MDEKDLTVNRIGAVDVEQLGDYAADIDVEISIMRVSAIDVITASSPSATEVSTASLRIEDVAIGIPGPPGPAGPPGPPGPPGSGTGSGLRTLEVSFASAQQDWPITHNFGTRAVEVNCYDLAGVNEYEVEVDIVDENQVIVHWYYAMSGMARVLG